MKAYLCEVGVLLGEGDREFEAYSNVYDKKHGFYDEEQYYCAEDIETIKERVKKYVSEGVESTYGVVSVTQVSDDLTKQEVEEIPVENENYLLTDVVFSIAKRNGELLEDFLTKEA